MTLHSTMTLPPPLDAPAGADLGYARPPDPARLAARGRRVLLLLGFIWIMNAMDLGFTLLAHRLGGFAEANPLFDGLLDDPVLIAVIKGGAMVYATAVLLAGRRRRLAEIACWAVCAVYVGLSLTWLSYFHNAGSFVSACAGGVLGDWHLPPPAVLERGGSIGRIRASSGRPGEPYSNGLGASEIGRCRPTLTSSPRAAQFTSRLDPP